METIFIAVATVLNFIVLKWKIEHERYSDFFLDITVLCTLSYLFGGTMSGMTIAMIASALFSAYLLFYPPQLSQEV